MDIKEQLIPVLVNKKVRIRACKIDKSPRRIKSLADYLQLNKEILFNYGGGAYSAFETNNRSMGGIWVGKNVKISPHAYLFGPLVIGDNSTIGDYSHIIGPTSIGSNTHIESDVQVRESII